MNKLNLTNLRKALREIIDTNYYIVFYRRIDGKNKQIGSLHLSTDRYGYPTKKSIIEKMIEIEIDDVFDYAQYKVVGKIGRLWVTMDNGVAFFEFESFAIDE